LKVQVNPAKCNGYGRCAKLSPDVFQLDEWGQSYVVEQYQEEVPPELHESATAAAKACPTDAIVVEDASGAGS